LDLAFATSNLILAYAIAFLLVPVGRMAVIYWLNDAIQQRNEARKQLAEELEKFRGQEGSTLHRKFDFAYMYRQEVIGVVPG
jgi:hypothetical protein